ncbi:hypothetical protein KAU40_01155 [Candidatus Parcubacteria bacterium]|nr:hypothetical protein [Candidatus Parcubacteria bacterium]
MIHKKAFRIEDSPNQWVRRTRKMYEEVIRTTSLRGWFAIREARKRAQKGWIKMGQSRFKMRRYKLKYKKKWKRIEYRNGEHVKILRDSPEKKVIKLDNGKMPLPSFQDLT